MASKPPKRPRDPNQLAKFIVDVATGEREELETAKVGDAQRRGGLSGGKARAQSLSPEQRSEIARIAAEARWKKS